MRKVLPALVILLILFSFINDANAQCAMCRASIEANLKDGGSTGSGINAGILYLMSIPYLIFMTIGFFWYKSTPTGKEKIAKFTAQFRRKFANS